VDEIPTVMEAYNLKLHQECLIDDVWYKRVIGGWLVWIDGGEYTTFIPYSKEFASRQAKQTDDEMFRSFIDWFNETTNRSFKYTDNYRRMFYARVKDGFTMEDFQRATKVMLKNRWVIDNKQQHPVHLLRPDNFQRYLNQAPQSEEHKSISYTQGW
jgi:uncharacterized phage protein (TIGR02220 family)